MKSLTFALLLSLTCFNDLSAHCPAHHLADAQTQAAAQKKSVLLVFVGGDWSKSSQIFREEVLKNAELKKKIDEHFIVHVLEYPQKQSERNETLNSLSEKYRATRFPTLLMTDFLGRPFGYTGYRAGGSEALLKSFSEARDLLAKRDAAFEEALKVQGVARAKAFERGLSLLPQSILREHYSSELVAIKKADPQGETKLVSELEKAEALQKERDAYRALFKEKKYDAVVQKSRMEAAKAQGEEAQRLSMYAVQALVSQKKYDDAMNAIEAMARLAPDSNFGKSAERYKKVVANVKERDQKKHEGKANAAKPGKPRLPIVSKPVAVVNDVKTLEDDLKQLRTELAESAKKARKATIAEREAALKINALENELKPLKDSQAKLVDEAKKARSEQLRLTKKEKTLREVIENYHAMQKRKREVSDLEKNAAELQKKAEELRNKSKEIESGQ